MTSDINSQDEGRPWNYAFFWPDSAVASLSAGSAPNQSLHQTPKNVALVNFLLAPQREGVDINEVSSL